MDELAVKAFDSRVDFSAMLPPVLRTAVEDATRRRRYPAGGVVYAQGVSGREVYRVVSGAVRMYYLSEDGQEFVHNIYQAGDWFGFSTLIDGEPRAQMAQAQTNLVLDVLSEEEFNAFRRSDAAFDRALLLLLSRDVRRLIGRVNSVAFEPLPSRLAWRIIKAVQADEDGRLLARISQSELAVMVDASRQRVNTILRQFEAEGLLVLSYRAIEVIDRAGLSRRIIKP
ncbi:Crp/Fnr family transcriptional regulator [Verticiella sediminum]|nr:Crp/Fnr family transcriptional regulator [Verticiella sediminum]